jgi:teichoic acid transport system permease protein
VLNPLLLASVYYLMVTIIRQKHEPLLFLHLMLALFAFQLISSSINAGASSVTTSGKLLLNTAFPRLLIPLSATRTAFFRFLPTVPVYLVFHLIFAPTNWHARMILSLFFLGTIIVFSMGLAALFATMTVYFRDTSSFLPYFVRIWMYLSPILWAPTMLRTLSPALQTIIQFNPAYAMLTGYSQLIQGGRIPPTWMWLSSAAWAIGAAVVGFWYFISREREFAVRIS